MPWFSDPQRDSRDDIRAAQQALVFAGYPHSEAVAEYETYLYRVRAALAAPRDIVWAGFLVGAAMAVVGLAAIILLAGLGGIVASLVEAPLVPAESAAPAPAGPARGSPLDFLPTILVTTWVLGMAGAGIALVTRNRWRPCARPGNLHRRSPTARLPAGDRGGLAGGGRPYRGGRLGAGRFPDGR